MGLFDREEVQSVEYIKQSRYEFLDFMEEEIQRLREKHSESLASVLMLKDLSTITWTKMQIEEELGIDPEE